MYIDRLTLPPLEDGTRVSFQHPLGGLACYLATLKSYDSPYYIDGVLSAFDHVQRTVHTLRQPEDEYEAEQLPDNSEALRNLGPHANTIIASELLSSITDAEQEHTESLPHYVFVANNYSGLLVPNAKQSEMYLMFGTKKTANIEGRSQPHPLARARLRAGLVSASARHISHELQDDVRVAVKVNSERLLTTTGTDVAEALRQFPWLSVGRPHLDHDEISELARWQEAAPAELSTELVMNIYQAKRGRAVLKARHDFATAVQTAITEADDATSMRNALKAFSILKQQGKYLVEADARTSHSDITKLVGKLCNKGLASMATEAVNNYCEGLAYSRDPRHKGLEGDLYFAIGRRGDYQACDTAARSYRQALELSPRHNGQHIHPIAVTKWLVRRDRAERLANELFNRKNPQRYETTPMRPAVQQEGGTEVISPLAA